MYMEITLITYNKAKAIYFVVPGPLLKTCIGNCCVNKCICLEDISVKKINK